MVEEDERSQPSLLTKGFWKVTGNDLPSSGRRLRKESGEV